MDDNRETFAQKEPQAARSKAVQAKEEAYEASCERFERIWRLVNELFEKVVSLRQNHGTRQELEAEIKNMARKKPLLQQAFKDSLHLVGNSKIKNLQADDCDPEHIFNVCCYQIIQNTCMNNSPHEEAFYKYNLISFYITMCKMLDACGRIDAAYPKNFSGLGLFFEDAYSSVGYLLSLYATVFASERYDRELTGYRLFKSGTRHEFSLLMELKHTLYERTPLDSAEANPSNAAIAGIRQFIEVWLRKSFDAWTRPDGTLIPLSAIFAALRDSIDEIKKDVLASGIKTIEKDINALAAINEYTNTFLHSNFRQLFWVPYTAFQYLVPTVRYYGDYYTPKIGTWHLVPPFIPKQSSCWQPIHDAIMHL